jgi:hypothetical protein
MTKVKIPTKELERAFENVATTSTNEIGLSEADEISYLIESYRDDNEIFQKIDALCDKIINGDNSIETKHELKSLCKSLF